jgi:hypothetical protein
LRIGCPLALLVAAGLVGSVELATWYVAGRPLWLEGLDYYLFFGSFIGLPFGALALARARDWLAWTVAALLTVAVWAFIFYDTSRGQGVNFSLGLPILFSPLAIAGAGLAVAGMRNRIPWALERDPQD